MRRISVHGAPGDMRPHGTLFGRTDRLISERGDDRGRAQPPAAHNDGHELAAAGRVLRLDSLDRWPVGARKCEMVRGRAVWEGPWDERDVEIARRTFPGRRVYLTQGDRALVVTVADDHEDLSADPQDGPTTGDANATALEDAVGPVYDASGA